MRKNATKLAAAVLSLAMVMTSVSVPASAAKTKKAKLNKTKATLYTNGSKSQKSTTLKLTVGGKKVKATFKSSNTKLLTVGKTTGKVTAKKNGTATVTATYKKKAYKCKITVKTYATSVSVKAKTLTLKEGKTATIKTTVKPSTASNKKVSFTSSNKSVATVSSKGKVTAKKAGTAKITVKALGAKKGVKAATVTVKVEKATPAPTETPLVTESPVPTETPSVATEGTISVTTNITGAAVEIYDGATLVTTGSTMSGYTYTTEKIKYGTYVVTVKKNGYKDFTQTVVLNADDAKVDAKLESVNEVKAELDKAYKVNDTQVQVNFTNKIAVPTKDNFSIEGLTISDAKITDDQKSVILTVSGMELDKTYTVKTNNILDANGKSVADGAVDFTARKITYQAKIEIKDVKTDESITQIKSDGKETAKFVVTLLDDAGNVIKDNAEVRFTTTAGNFAETKVSANSGVATNIFTSEISATQKDALVTATVVESANKDLINTEAKRTLSMKPVIDADNKGASLTDVMVETCDRVILYFNKDVNVTDYTKNNDKHKYAYDSSKMEIKIADNAGTYETVEQCEKDANKNVYEPIALAPVPGESKALYAILDTDTDKDKLAKKANYLTDNAKTIVKITDKTKAVPTTETKSTNVTDIRTPSMLSVEAVGLKKIKITFSEPVQNATNGKADDVSSSAELLKKWVIDNTNLDDDKYGVAGKDATATVGRFNDNTLEDTRNVVTITLGKDAYNNEIYFKAGKHSVQGNKIGDWANVTDTANNIINTQTLDFVIEADETAPTATVKAESPEQFDLKFNTPVDLGKLKENLKLQQKVDNDWKEVSGNPINIRPVADTEDKEYIVELTDDWTNILKTKETKKNYYNFDFRLYMKKDVITNVLNGLKNAEITLDLNDKIMKEPDVTSAELSGVYKDDNTVVIDISEPVQINLKNDKGEDTRKLTPKEEQLPKISEPIVQFISSGDKETIQGKIVSISDHDNQITVVPDKTISTGTWRVVVRNVSDDVGNTSPTLVKNDFVVDKPIVSDDFKVLWVVAVPAGKDNPITAKVYENNNEDIIYVKFNKQIKTYDNAANAGATTNYTVNGYSVPTDSKIDSSVVGYNEKAVTKNSYSDLVAIHLKAGTLTKDSNTINISKTLESVAGDKLGNGGSKLLTKSGDVFKWEYKQCNAGVISPKGDAITVAGLQEFFNEGKYSDYDLRGLAFDANDKSEKTFTLKHTSSVDFDGKSIKELDINTQETGVLEISHVTAEKITVNAPNADVILNGVTVTKANKPGEQPSNIGEIEVIDILDGTLTLKDTTVGILNVTDSNAGAIELSKGADIKKFVINTTGTITLIVDSTFDKTLPTIEVEKACTIHAENNDEETNVAFKVADSVNADDINIKASGTYANKVTATGGKDGKVSAKPEVEKEVEITKDSKDGKTNGKVQTKAVVAKTDVTISNVEAGEGGYIYVTVDDLDPVPVKISSADDVNAVASKIKAAESKFEGYDVSAAENVVTFTHPTKIGNISVKVNKGDLTTLDTSSEQTAGVAAVMQNTAGEVKLTVKSGSNVNGKIKVTFAGETKYTTDIKAYITKESDIATAIKSVIDKIITDNNLSNSYSTTSNDNSNFVTISTKNTGDGTPAPEIEVVFEKN